LYKPSETDASDERLQSYTDFDWDDLPIDEQEFEDYKAST
jgi:hypothetical protein